MDAGPLVVLAIVLGVGAVLAILFMVWDLARLRREEWEETHNAEWRVGVARALGVQIALVPASELSVDIDGVAVEVRSPAEGMFELSGTCPERDLVARLDRAGEVLASGSGWEALDPSRRAVIDRFVRDGGSIGFGRTAFRANDVDAAASAASRIAALTKSLSGTGKQDMAAILRRVTSADDPGRVSIAESPKKAGQLSAPGSASAGSLSPKNLLTTVTRLWAAHGTGEDRVLAIPHEGLVVLVVADGAGGTGGGAAAADRILARVQQVVPALCSGVYSPAELLAELDRTLVPTGGEAAAVVAIVSATGVRGACAGDVEAILLAKAETIDLTSGRRRKPLLGSGAVEPVSFSAEGVGRVLIATDGLFGYAKHARIVETLQAGSLESLPERLVELVRLPNGDLQDDVGLVVSELA